MQDVAVTDNKGASDDKSDYDFETEATKTLSSENKVKFPSRFDVSRNKQLLQEVDKFINENQRRIENVDFNCPNDDILQAVPKLTNLTAIRIHDPFDSDERAKIYSCLITMNYLTIEHLEMSYIQSCCFSIPKQLYNLKDLVIKNCSDQVAKALIDSSVNSLTHLTLWNINLNIPIKRPIPNLKGVGIDNSEIDVERYFFSNAAVR